MNRGMGKGIKLDSIVPVPIPAAVEKPPASPVDMGPFSPKPSFPDQLTFGPQYHRLGHEEFRTFKVTDPAEAEKYTEFKKLCDPVGAPAILIRKEQDYFSPELGTLLITARFKRVYYAKLSARPVRAAGMS